MARRVSPDLTHRPQAVGGQVSPGPATHSPYSVLGCRSTPSPAFVNASQGQVGLAACVVLPGSSPPGQVCSSNCLPHNSMELADLHLNQTGPESALDATSTGHWSPLQEVAASPFLCSDQVLSASSDPLPLFTFPH